MNTIGKILVILNLIFALVVGGFLVIDYATRSNWKVAYEAAKSELLIAKTNYQTSGQTLRDSINTGKRDKAENDELKQKLKDQELVAAAKEESQQLQLKEAIEKAKDADKNAQEAIAAKDRMKEEIKGLNATLLNRDNFIIALQIDNKKLRTEAIAQEDIAKRMQSRNEYLLAQNQDLLRKIALRDAGVGNDNALAKDPNAPNPPATYIKGKIEQVNADDRKLVQISIGTDQGVNKSHTLEVYRLSPRPEYLGRIRIVDAKAHTAVGQLMRSAISGSPLQVGDIVASSLNNQSQ